MFSSMLLVLASPFMSALLVSIFIISWDNRPASQASLARAFGSSTQHTTRSKFEENSLLKSIAIPDGFACVEKKSWIQVNQIKPTHSIAHLCRHLKVIDRYGQYARKYKSSYALCYQHIFISPPDVIAFKFYIRAYHVRVCTNF